MAHPAEVQSNLEIQSKQMNEMCVDGERHTFGRDTRRIFEEIDVIRKKQIELATEHISLESIDDMSLPTNSADTEDEYKRNLDYFNTKEKALKSLMSKLDTLGQIMNDFREASDLNPHTMNRRVSDTHVAMATSTSVGATTTTNSTAITSVSPTTT